MSEVMGTNADQAPGFDFTPETQWSGEVREIFTARGQRIQLPVEIIEDLCRKELSPWVIPEQFVIVPE